MVKIIFGLKPILKISELQDSSVCLVRHLLKIWDQNLSRLGALAKIRTCAIRTQGVVVKPQGMFVDLASPHYW